MTAISLCAFKVVYVTTREFIIKEFVTFCNVTFTQLLVMALTRKEKGKV